MSRKAIEALFQEWREDAALAKARDAGGEGAVDAGKEAFQKILDGKIDAPQAGAEQSKDRGMGR
jgi:hypothetical protein